MQSANHTFIIERLAALFLIILLSPFFAAIYVMIFLETGRNPIFKQRRGLTLNKYLFNIYKFRTLSSSIPVHFENQIFSKNSDKSLFLLTGNFLRRTGLDELPQLINIVQGKMRFIGPRPLSVEDLEIIKSNNSELYLQREAISLKPGISGYWQVFGDKEKGVKNLVEFDNEYAKRKCFTFDFKIILKTLQVMMFALHSDSILPGKKKTANRLLPEIKTTIEN